MEVGGGSPRQVVKRQGHVEAWRRFDRACGLDLWLGLERNEDHAGAHLDCGAGGGFVRSSRAIWDFRTPWARTRTSDPTSLSSARPPNAQNQIDAIYRIQERNQFGKERSCILLKPGKYNLNIMVGFYTQVAGLGLSPEDVAVTGNLESNARWFGGNATCNFWCAAENLTITPKRGRHQMGGLASHFLPAYPCQGEHEPLRRWMVQRRIPGRLQDRRHRHLRLPAAVVQPK